MDNLFPRGSEWRKWDLHMHSTASDGKLNPKEIMEIARKEGLSVIALTDHHTVNNVDELKLLGKENGITVISGVEFRTEYGSKSVHIIGLLPDEYNGIKLTQENIEHLILDNLGLSRVIIEAKGREKEKKPDMSDEDAFKAGMFEVQVNLKEAADLIHRYGGLISVHAGNKANTIEEMRHDGKGESNVKDVVDSLGPVKEELLKKYIDICEIGSPTDKNAEFYIKQFNLPTITASDAHDRKRLGKIFTWIKADPTFEGLRQIKYEPELRVRIQDNIPEMKSDYQVIDHMIITHSDFKNQEIVFNPYLNTIIGGRSSGKSILLGAIAKAANYKGDFKKDKNDYNEYIKTVANTVQLIWKDGKESSERTVEYFPQSYINDLASKSQNTIRLIENILKDNEDRKQAFEFYDSTIVKNRVELTAGIENLALLIEKASNAEENLKLSGDLSGVTSEISKLTKQIDDVKAKSQVKLTEADEQNYTKLKEERENLQKTIENQKIVDNQLYNLKAEKLVKDISGDLLGLPESIRSEFESKLLEITNDVNIAWNDFIDCKISDSKILVLDSQKRIEEIENDKKYIDGETYYKENTALKELSDARESEKKKEKQIIDAQLALSEIYKAVEKQKWLIIELQKQKFVSANELSKKVGIKKEEISITPKLVFDADAFEEFIKNCFNNKSNSYKELKEFEYVDEEQFIDTLRNIIEKIMNGELTLKNGLDKKQALLNLLSNNFHKLIYSVDYQGDDLDSMSEGKKAYVILRLVLDFNDNQCPILIDQPEDDLDNRTIYDDLVRNYLRKKKIDRQIILVTHNPNIVVTADSEEVIVANQHGVHNENTDGVKFEYCSGALENSFTDNTAPTVLGKKGIREHVCEILEGGDIAFIKREMKYSFNT